MYFCSGKYYKKNFTIMKKKILLGMLMLLACMEISAVPAFNVRKQVTLEDGSKVTATLYGDEFYAFYATDDGMILTETASGKYRLVSKQAHAKAKQAAKTKRTEANKLYAMSLRKNAGAMTDKKRGLVILAQFQDVKFSEKATQDYFNRMFNETGFNENDNTGSVSEYFHDQSYGQLTLEFDVVGPVTVPNALAYYGANDTETGASDAHVFDFIADACKCAENLTDFTQYDWDNDGLVDNVFVLYAGYSEAMGASSDCIWPHQWVVYDRELMIDGVRVYNYACSNELMGIEGTILQGIGTACHEFSHTIGLADTYDTDYSTPVEPTGLWDLMGEGSYLGETYGNGTCPIAYTAFERSILGWLEPKEIDEQTVVTDMKPLEESPEAYVLYNEGKRNEFYMLENRQLPKWGKTLKAHGLMITHVDFDNFAWTNNEFNDDDDHQRYVVVSASNALAYGQSDLFPGTSGNTSFTDTTTPAATLYNANDDGSFLLGKSVENISESEDGLISFTACAGLPTRPYGSKAVQNTDGTISCSWNEMEGVASYEVELQGKLINPSPLESIILKERFTSVPKEEGTEDISSSFDLYCDNIGWTGGGVYSSPYGLKIDKNGYIFSPFNMGSTKESATLYVTVRPAVEGQETAFFIVVSDGYANVTQYWEETITKETTFVVTAHIAEGSYYSFSLQGSESGDKAKPFCVSAFDIYNGTYTAEDLAKDPSEYPPTVMTPLSLSTTTTSCLFTNVEKGYDLTMRVRSVLANGRKSLWSLPINVTVSTEINSVDSDNIPSADTSNTIYDLSGRPVSSLSRPGIYIRNGKKIVVSNGK